MLHTVASGRYFRYAGIQEVVELCEPGFGRTRYKGASLVVEVPSITSKLKEGNQKMQLGVIFSLPQWSK